MIIMPLGDIFMNTFNITPSEYSLLVSAYAIAAFFSSIIGMLYLDFFNRKKVLLFVYLGFSIGTILCAFSNSYLLLLSMRFITGLFGGIIGALVLSIVSDLYLFKERGKAMGVVMAAFSAASALGVPFGLYLAEKYGWEFPFLALGIGGLGITFLLYLFFPDMTDHLKELDSKRKPRQTLLLITQDKNQITALITSMVVVLGHFLIIPFITPYMIRNVGLDQSQIVYIFLFGGIATIFTSRIIGGLVDKLGVMKVFFITLVISIIPTIGITHLGNSTLAIALVFTTLFFVFGSGRMIPPNTIITAAASQENRGSFLSMRSGMAQLAIAFSSFLSGIIVVESPDGSLLNYGLVAYLSIGVCFLGLFLTARIRVAKGN
jgi:predicted MFS family arabinose efflux permease